MLLAAAAPSLEGNAAGTCFQARTVATKVLQEPAAQRKPDVRCVSVAIAEEPLRVTSAREGNKRNGDADCHDALEERVRILKQRALHHTWHRETDKALRCYLRALELAPTGRLAHICLTNRATLRLRNGDIAGARMDCDAAIALRPHYGKAHTRLGLILAHSGDVTGALAAYQQALRLDPLDDVAISLMADAKPLLERRWRQEDARRAEETRRAALAEDSQTRLAAEEAYVQFVEACAARTEAELSGRAGAKSSVGGSEANGSNPRSNSLPRAMHTALEAAKRAEQEAEGRLNSQSEAKRTERTADLRRKARASNLRAQRRAAFGADGDPSAPHSPGGLEGWGWDRERERIRSRRGAAASLSVEASSPAAQAAVTGAVTALQPPHRGGRVVADGSAMEEVAAAVGGLQRSRQQVVRGSSAGGTNTVAAAAAAGAAAAAALEAPPPLQTHCSSGGITPPVARVRPPRPHRSGAREEPPVSPDAAVALSLARSPKDSGEASAAAAVLAGSAWEYMPKLAPWARAAGVSPGSVLSSNAEQDAAVATTAASPSSTSSPSCGGAPSSLSPLGPADSFEGFATNDDSFYAQGYSANRCTKCFATTNDDGGCAVNCHANRGYPVRYGMNGYTSGGGRRNGRMRAPMDTVALAGSRPRGTSVSAMQRRARMPVSGCEVEDEESSHDECVAGSGWGWQDSAASGAETDSLAAEAWTWQPAHGGSVPSVTTATAGSSACSWKGAAVILGTTALPGCTPPLGAAEPAAAAANCVNSRYHSGGNRTNLRPLPLGSGGGRSILSSDGDALRAAVRSWLEAVVGRRSKVPLGTWLADGRVLVDVANALAPGSATWQPGVTPAEREHNVSSFLRACADLGMPENTLFLPSDLLDGDDLQSVVECLHFLARHLTLLAPRFDGPVLQEA